MLANTVIDNTIWTLRRAFKKNKAPIWKALENSFQVEDQIEEKLMSVDCQILLKMMN